MSKISAKRYEELKGIISEKTWILLAFERASKKLEELKEAESVIASLSKAQITKFENEPFSYFDGSLKAARQLFIEDCSGARASEGKVFLGKTQVTTHYDLLFVKQAKVNGWLIKLVSSITPVEEGDVEIVFEASKGKVKNFYKLEGYSSSYGGILLSEVSKVKAKTKQVTYYE